MPPQTPNAPIPPTELTPEATLAYIRQLVARVFGDDVPDPHDEEDLFQHGMDRPREIRLRDSIFTLLRSFDIDVSELGRDIVYQNPSIEALTALVLSLSASQAPGEEPEAIDSPDPTVRALAMRLEIASRVEALPPRQPDAVFHLPDKHVVVVTGTTGALGSQLLVQLLKRDDVDIVYALNRRSSVVPLPVRQVTALVDRCGFRPEDAQAVLQNERLLLMEADLEDEKLGLAPETYEVLRWTATVLIPSAWKLDFDGSLSSFAPQLDSVCAFARLARLSPLKRPPRIVFPSSATTVQGWREGSYFSPPTPEDPMPDLVSNNIGCLPSVRAQGRRLKKGSTLDTYTFPEPPPSPSLERAAQRRPKLGVLSRLSGSGSRRGSLETPASPGSVLARLSPRRGSVDSVGNSWKVPEQSIKDLSVAVGSGYSESKAVAEKVLEKADIGAVAVRIGQLSGSRRAGVWSVTDWFPLLLKAGQKIGALPDKAGDVPWISIDTAASVLLDIAFSPIPPSSPIAHLVHPRPVTWHDLFTHLSDALGLPLIPFPGWLARLGQAVSIPGAERENAALNLLPFYCVIGAASGVDGRDAMGDPLLDTDRTEATSPTLLRADPLDSRDVKAWVEYWHKVGFLY